MSDFKFYDPPEQSQKPAGEDYPALETGPKQVKVDDSTHIARGAGRKKGKNKNQHWMEFNPPPKKDVDYNKLNWS